ncbi:MAG: MiaB/RimO family radical SAM methylthiotransferase [Candidatus Cloacimonas sp.]|jgi:ribosomal protein S12 methylthiotransferase|nr:MiaB/RimO family radical SAM methylthiotransferase [Candidatus Cloacimonas sp.]
MKTCYIESLGCAKNLVDSERFAAILAAAGYQLSFDVEGAEIVLINTCAFLQSSLAELEDVLDVVVELKQAKQIRRIIVSGCVTKRNLQDFQDAYPEVDNWIDLKDFDAFAKLLKSRNEQLRIPLEEGFHTYLRISDGCQNYCSYCKIPSIRGVLQSVPIPELVAEAKRLAQTAVLNNESNEALFPQELILIAQDTCLYGLDIYGKQALPELLAALHEVQGFKWIRLMYLHPDHFLPEWLPLFKLYPRLLPYFEVPIQHCSTKILKAMNRSKGKEELAELFAQIKQEIPNAAIRTTLITGFPGETKREWEELCTFIDEIPFLHVGTFAYSPEDGTPAYSFAKRPATRTALSRQDKLEMLWADIQAERMNEIIDKSFPTLVEQAVEGTENEYRGRVWFQAPDIDGNIFIDAPNLQPGSIINVTIDDAIGNTLFGHPTNNED